MAQGYSYEQAAAMSNQSATNTASGANQNAINSLMSQGYSYEQAVALSNQGSTNTQTLANQSSANNAAGTNANLYGSALSYDATTYNNYIAWLNSQGANTLGNQTNTYLNSFAPNPSVTSAIGGSANQVGSAYTGAYNSATAGQGAAVGSLFSAAGTAAAGGAFG